VEEKAAHYGRDKAFVNCASRPEWPKVADAVIEAKYFYSEK
jgi:hypothetical protein